MHSPKITVLTATLNAGSCISRLISSLQAQTDKDFEWLVVDGCSTDNTRELIDAAIGLRVRILVAKDFGIYDALNRGTQSIDGDYYVVTGADDILSPDAIHQYRKASIDGEPDFVAASVRQNGKIITPRSGLGWLYGMSGIASSHAVGLLIRVDLHQRFGYYSSRFPIAADQFFVKQALAGGAKIYRKKFVAGEFSTDGTSGSDPVGLLTDIFRVQLLTERFVSVQYLLFITRLFKLYLWSVLRLTSFRHRRLARTKF